MEYKLKKYYTKESRYFPNGGFFSAGDRGVELEKATLQWFRECQARRVDRVMELFGTFGTFVIHITY